MTTVNYVIGADVHQSTTTLCTLGPNQQVFDTRTLETSEYNLRNYLAFIPDPKAFVMEETDLAQWLYSTLHPLVTDFLVCNPYRNFLLKDGAKTDRIDAQRLAQLYRSGLLKSVFHTTDPKIKLRDLARSWRECTKAIVQTKNQYHSHLKREGLSEDKDYKKLSLYAHFQVERLSLLLQQRDLLEGEIQKSERKFKDLRLLKKIPGIGPVGAMKLVASIIDPHRFSTKYRFWSYCGLVKHPKESGGKSLGQKRSQANRDIKGVFKTAAMSCIQGGSPMRTYYDASLEKGLDERKARNALARKIAATTLACWKKQENYDPFYDRLKKERKEITQRKINHIS